MALCEWNLCQFDEIFIGNTEQVVIHECSGWCWGLEKQSLLKGWCTWHKTWLQMMMLGLLSRVMMVWQLCCAKNMQNSHFLCATFSPARKVPYFQLTWAILWSNRTTQWFNTTKGVQKLCHRSCSETIAPQVFRNHSTAHWFYRTVQCHSFWTPAVVLNRCAVLLDQITLGSVANIELCGWD